MATLTLDIDQLEVTSFTTGERIIAMLTTPELPPESIERTCYSCDFSCAESCEANCPGTG
jgi:hypothetical protein